MSATPNILYQSDCLLVINKPSGLPVHSGSGGGDNLGNYMEQWRFGYEEKPQMAHRLDRDTSGCLVLGRTKDVVRRLGKLFALGLVSKTYWAVVEGKFAEPEGRISIPLRKKSPLPYHWHMEAHPEGQESLTDYKVLGECDGYTFVELYPVTGRTHQLRIHCLESGCPIVGDKLYGNGTAIGQMHLHARSLKIPYNYGEQPIEVVAPPPAHMLELLTKCGYSLSQ
ncbi:MAG: ribosomal large subunit pseudouridine synthase [Rickettsiaceae bacterium]|jgi:RluA family pseudouridine synthase|nr:ribosomal large subunit pseudouridine synthase [Rickettsiaceae bacterium]